MENRLKERLTGAAILVALIVLLVPEMFRGPHVSGGASSGAAEGPPVRSYTLDLSSTAGAPITSGETAAQPSATSAQPPAPSAAATTPPPAAAAPEPLTPASPPSVASTPAPPRPASVPATAHHAATPAAAGRWSVQLGLFASHDNAERLVRMAEAKGFHAGVSAEDSKGRYHVRATGLADKAAAEALLARLKAAGLPGAVVPP